MIFNRISFYIGRGEVHYNCKIVSIFIYIFGVEMCIKRPLIYSSIYEEKRSALQFYHCINLYIRRGDVH